MGKSSISMANMFMYLQKWRKWCGSPLTPVEPSPDSCDLPSRCKAAALATYRGNFSHQPWGKRRKMAPVLPKWLGWDPNFWPDGNIWEHEVFKFTRCWEQDFQPRSWQRGSTHNFSTLILLTSSSRFDFATYFWDANDIWRWKFQSTATTATSTNINCLRDFEQVRQDGFLLDLQAKWHGSMRHPQASLDPRELVKQAFPHGWLWSPKCPNSSKTMTIADKLPYSSRVTA